MDEVMVEEITPASRHRHPTDELGRGVARARRDDAILARIERKPVVWPLRATGLRVQETDSLLLLGLFFCCCGAEMMYKRNFGSKEPGSPGCDDDAATFPTSRRRS